MFASQSDNVAHVDSERMVKLSLFKRYLICLRKSHERSVILECDKYRLSKDRRM